MIMKKLKMTTAIVAVALIGSVALSDGYGPFPVTLNGYSCLLYTSDAADE